MASALINHRVRLKHELDKHRASARSAARPVFVAADDLAAVLAEVDALRRKTAAVERLHVWENEDRKRFVFADDLGAALEIPGF